jgi:hypothetical protein
MPEASMHKNSQSPFRKDYIWTARQVFTMQSEAVAQGMEQPPNFSLRPCILASNARHHLTAFASADYVHDARSIFKASQLASVLQNQ